MRPAPIPDEAIWDGAQRVVIAPPGGDLTNPDIAPVEALLDQASIGPRMSVRCILEDGDLERLQAGGVVWVSFYGGQMLPFSVDVAGPDASVPPSVRIDVEFHDDGRAPDFTFLVSGVDEEHAADFAEGCAEALALAAAAWRTERSEG